MLTIMESDLKPKNSTKLGGYFLRYHGLINAEVYKAIGLLTSPDSLAFDSN